MKKYLVCLWEVEAENGYEMMWKWRKCQWYSSVNERRSEWKKIIMKSRNGNNQWKWRKKWR